MLLKISTKMKYPTTWTVNQFNPGVTLSMDLHKFLCSSKKIKITLKDTQAQYTKTTMIVPISSKISIAIKLGLRSKLNSKAKITDTFKIFKNRKKSKKKSRKRNRLMNKWVAIKIRTKFTTTKKLNITTVNFPLTWTLILLEHIKAIIRLCKIYQAECYFFK